MADPTKVAKEWIGCQTKEIVNDSSHLLHAVTSSLASTKELKANLVGGASNMSQLVATHRAVEAVAVGWAVGAVVFGVGLWSGSKLCVAARISSNHKIVASIAGLVIVPASGIAAGHAMQFASIEYGRTVYGDPLFLSPLIQHKLATTNDNNGAPVYPGPMQRQHQLRAYETVFYATMSLLAFRLCRGRLRYVAPSDIAKPGTFANERGHIPARYEMYCDAAEKDQIIKFGRLYGCHHCGVRNGMAFWRRGGGVTWIGDHQPPNKYATQSVSQKFYPQCEPCSQVQARAVRADRRTLRSARTVRSWHVWWPWPVLWLGLVPFTYDIHQRYLARKKDDATKSP